MLSHILISFSANSGPHAYDEIQHSVCILMFCIHQIRSQNLMYVCVWINVDHVTPTEPILMGMAIDYSVDIHATFNSSS